MWKKRGKSRGMFSTVLTSCGYTEWMVRRKRWRVVESEERLMAYNLKEREERGGMWGI